MRKKEKEEERKKFRRTSFPPGRKGKDVNERVRCWEEGRGEGRRHLYIVGQELIERNLLGKEKGELLASAPQRGEGRGLDSRVFDKRGGKGEEGPRSRHTAGGEGGENDFFSLSVHAGHWGKSHCKETISVQFGGERGGLREKCRLLGRRSAISPGGRRKKKSCEERKRGGGGGGG